LGNNFFDPVDLQIYQQTCKERPYNVSVVGGSDAQVCRAGQYCEEAFLDLEILGSLTAPIPLIDYSNNTNFYSWALAMNADPSPAPVISFSYGMNEYRKSTIHMEYLNFEFLKLVIRGVTLVVAAGDDGVSGGIPDGLPPLQPGFIPVFPASSPYVLTVGGTELVNNVTGAEYCSSSGGGGFSNLFNRTQYQFSAVSQYLEQRVPLPSQSNYRIAGRAYPDLSALYGAEISYCIQSSGLFIAQGGTSASAPVVASIMALLNEIRLSRGAPVLGYVNPYLANIFTFRGGFNDILTGSNPGSETNTGFPATLGWDACSGMGTPNFTQLASFISSEPTRSDIGFDCPIIVS